MNPVLAVVRYPFLAILTLLIISCNDGNKIVEYEGAYVAPQDIRAIFSPNIGTQQSYQHLVIGFDSGAGTSKVINQQVTDTFSVNNKLYYKILRGFYGRNADSSWFTIEYIDSTTYSRWYNWDGEGLGSMCDVVLQSPITVGNHWPTDYQGGLSSATATILNIDTSIIVRGKSYTHVIHLKKASTYFGESDIFIALGIGIIKEETDIESYELIPPLIR
jgi:hypothetical protein